MTVVRFMLVRPPYASSFCGPQQRNVFTGNLYEAFRLALETQYVDIITSLGHVNLVFHARIGTSADRRQGIPRSRPQQDSKIGPQWKKFKPLTLYIQHVRGLVYLTARLAER